MAVRNELCHETGDLVWLIERSGSMWARVVETRPDAVCLEATTGEHLGWYDKSFVLPWEVVHEVLVKAGKTDDHTAQ